MFAHAVNKSVVLQKDRGISGGWRSKTVCVSVCVCLGLCVCVLGGWELAVLLMFLYKLKNESML